LSASRRERSIRRAVYPLRFEIAVSAWTGVTILFDDAQVKVQKAKLEPGKPLLVQVEGVEPTEHQLEQCRQIWSALRETFGFNMATLCPALFPYSRDIMAINSKYVGGLAGGLILDRIGLSISSPQRFTCGAFLVSMPNSRTAFEYRRGLS
jgi:hypothetical protein